MEYHSLPLNKLYERYNSSEKGLSRFNYLKNYKKYGDNELKKEKKATAFEIFLSQFKNVLIYILLGAVLISVFLGEWIDAIVIAVILILNAVVGFFQEYKAEKSIEALQRLASLKAKVLREGKQIIIDVRDVVPGDIVFVEAGDKIPADSRLLNAVHLEVQESSLTGESLPVRKDVCELNESVVLAERKNMIFSGTIVTKGRASALVVATGMGTELGHIAKLVQDQDTKSTPLQNKLEVLGKKIGIVVLVLSFIIFVTGFLRWGNLLGMFMIAVALAVAAIPEGLPIVVTISLAIGTKKLLAKNALMRRLSSVETLGSVTVICSDKTGTFTKNEMTVKKLFVNNKIVEITGTGYKAIGDFLIDGKKVDPKQFKLLLMIGALNNNSSFDKEKVIGDPTEACLLVSAKKSGLNLKYLQENNKRIDEIEFTSERKIMTTIHKIGKKRVIFTKGAPDFVLEKCDRMMVNGKIKKMTIQDKKYFLEMNKKLASEALRVLAFAYKEFDHPQNYEKNLIFVGLQGMIDPPREEVKKAVQDCKNAGIRVVMITGDNEETAKAIAKEIGIEGKAINGKDIDNINLNKEIENISIYARVDPSHKMKIVDALQKKHHIVAMTGDGVNDAPALKKADIGIAMGITGTDVSKEAADMVLTDDNFASIVRAIEQGRGVYDNIRKFLALLLSGNIGEVMIIFIALLIGLPLPLIAIQILLINLVTDGLPATALSADPFEPGAMKRKPKKSTSQLYQNLYPYLVVYPTLMIIVVLSLFTWFLRNDSLIKAQTVAFLCVGLFELYQAFSCRSIIYPVFKVGLFKNKWLNLAVLSSLIVLFAVVFVPFFQSIFKTVSLSLFELLIVIVLSSVGAMYLEIYKFFKSRLEVRV